MNEEKLLKTLVEGDVKALDKIMKKYSGYVCTTARNFSHGALFEKDIDEISAIFDKILYSQKFLHCTTAFPYISIAQFPCGDE